MGHHRLLSKSCILFCFCYEKVILNYYPGCKRRNAGLKSPNTPTHLEVLRNGGAKVNAELAGFSTRQRRRQTCTFYPRLPRSSVSDLFLPSGQLISLSLQTNRLRTGSSFLFCNLWTIKGYRLSVYSNDVNFDTKSTTSVQANSSSIQLLTTMENR